MGFVSRSRHFEENMFLPHPLVQLSIVGSLCDREVACSASDPQGLIEHQKVAISSDWSLFSCRAGALSVVVSTAAFHARVRGSFSRSRRFERNKNVSSPSTRKIQYCGEPP